MSSLDDFIPKTYLVTIQEFIKFILSSIYLHWRVLIISLLGTGFIISALIYNLPTYLINPFLINISLLTVLTISIYTTVFYADSTYSYLNRNILELAFYGCYTIKESNILVTDISSDSIDEIIESSIINIKSTVTSYAQNHIPIRFIKIQRYNVPILGIKGINKRLKGRLHKQRHLSSIHFTIDTSTHKLSVIVNHNHTILSNTQLFQYIDDTLSDIATDNVDNKHKVDVIIKIYLAIYSQILTDHNIEIGNNVFAHQILDDTKKIMIDIKHRCKDLSQAKQKKVLDFLNIWGSHIERERAIILINQKEYTGAVKHIFNSMKLNPNFPYQDFDSLKIDYAKRYASEFSISLNETRDAMIENGFKEEEVGPKVDDTYREAILIDVLFKDMPYNYAIVKDIMSLAYEHYTDTQLQHFISLVESELSVLDYTQPFNLLAKSEIIRYLKKGEEKVNEVYLERMSECINPLKELINIAPDFVITYSKLGSLMFLYGAAINDQEMIDKGMEYFLQGNHMFTQLGFQ